MLKRKEGWYICNTSWIIYGNRMISLRQYLIITYRNNMIYDVSVKICLFVWDTCTDNFVTLCILSSNIIIDSIIRVHFFVKNWININILQYENSVKFVWWVGKLNKSLYTGWPKKRTHGPTPWRLPMVYMLEFLFKQWDIGDT